MGGMGAVYQAWDQELGVAVALKVIRPEATADPAAAALEMERRFKRELLLARQVTHANVVRIHDLGELNGIKYITMPYVQGDDLATRLKRDGNAAGERRAEGRAPGGAGARGRARGGRRPPRPQAAEHHDRRRRARADHGLRHRAIRRRPGGGLPPAGAVAVPSPAGSRPAWTVGGTTLHPTLRPVDPATLGPMEAPTIAPVGPTMASE